MKRSKTNRHQQRSWWRGRMAMGLALLMTLLFGGTALAAEVLAGDTYILPRGEVVNDDLYVTGGEIIIEGTVEGDLVVTGGYIEVNGVVMGDLLAAGGAVVIAGVVQDDVRAAGGAVILTGSVGDDFFAAAGGGWPGASAMPIAGLPGQEGRSVPQGMQLSAGSTIAGDAYLAGGEGTVAAAIGGDLLVGMGTLTFAGRVAGDANLNAQSLSVAEGAVVQGELTYSAAGNATVPDGVSSSVIERPSNMSTTPTPTRTPIRGFFQWLLRTALVLAGYLLSGWLLWSFAPRRITAPVAVMTERPMEAGVIGLLAVVAVVPVGAALTFLAIIFWGWFPGGAIMASFIFGLVSLLWLLSPLIVGLWVGRKAGELTGVGDSELSHLLLGIAVIVLAGRLLMVVPCVGALIFQVMYLASLAMTVGAWYLARQRPPADTPLLATSATPAA